MTKYVLALALLAGTASAQSVEMDHYDPRSTAWNGMATFVGLAEGMGYEVTPVSSLEWGALGSNDILLVAPTRGLLVATARPADGDSNLGRYASEAFAAAFDTRLTPRVFEWSRGGALSLFRAALPMARPACAPPAS